MARRDEEPAEAVAAFAVVLDELAVAGDVEQALWFGAPAVKVGGRIFLALRRGTLIARLGAEEVDARVLAGDGVRFDPSGKGKPMKDWLESNAEHGEWVELGLAALAFTAGQAKA
jgi:hypothetical protein